MAATPIQLRHDTIANLGALATAEVGYDPATGVWWFGDSGNKRLRQLAPNAQAGASYAIVTSNFARVVIRSHGSSMGSTLAQAGTTGFESGWWCWVLNAGPGDLTITPTTSTIGGAATLVLTAGESASVVSDGTNYQVLIKDSSVDLAAHIAATAAHGATGAVVGTTNVQTLTNKTMTAPAIAGATLTGTIDASGATSVLVPTPSTAGQAANKSYVDAVINGLYWHAAVRLKTTGNITLSGEQSIDGQTTSADRVLVASQSTASQNGIYVSGAGAWTRADDMTAGSSAAGEAVFVQEGTANADTAWVCTNDEGSDVVGTNDLAFAQFNTGGVADGDKGDITVSTSGTVWTIDNDVVSNAKLRDSAAVSVIGRSANSTGDPADIAAGANDRVFRRVSDALDFGQLTVGMAPDQLWTYAKLQNVSATDRVLGRTSSGAGVVEEIATTGSGNVVRATSPTLTTPVLGTPSSGNLSSCTGKDWDKISEQTASNTASIDFTGLSSAYREYELVYSGVVPITDGAHLLLRTSTNNGSSYDSGASDYRWCGWAVLDNGGSGVGNSGGDTAIRLIQSVDNASTSMTGGVAVLLNPSAAQYFGVTNICSYWNSGGVTGFFNSQGQRVTAADVDAIRILFSTGNISTGTFTLYGRKS